MRSRFKWTIILSLLTPLLFLIAVAFMAGGHGWYEPAMTLFPFGMLETLWLDRITQTSLFIGTLQFPLYGFLIDKTRCKHYGNKLILALVIMHLALAVFIIIYCGEEWK
ncbi:MAG TPA: hypothetical protein VGD17_01180 [Chitinophagaceae bacterium]